MRVISQDGFYDFPYDLVCLTLDENDRKTIYAIPNPTMESLVNYDTGFPVMGEYSTEEKAKRVLEKLHDKYLSRMELDGGFDTVNNCYVQPNFWVLPRIFQFPSDEDVEA